MLTDSREWPEEYTYKINVKRINTRTEIITITIVPHRTIEFSPLFKINFPLTPNNKLDSKEFVCVATSLKILACPINENQLIKSIPINTIHNNITQ